MKTIVGNEQNDLPACLGAAGTQTLQVLIEVQLGMGVVFDTTEGSVFGIVTKINRKTANVMTEDGTRYRVSPSLLKPITGLE